MFIGYKQIKNVNGPVVEFEDGTIEQFSELTLPYITTQEVSTDTDVRNKKCDLIATKIQQLLIEYNSYTSELDYIFKKLVDDLKVLEDKATTKVWNVQYEYKIPLRKMYDMIKESAEK